MKEEIAKALAQLVTIFSWIIEAVVAFTLPGIFIVSLIIWRDPQLYVPIGYFSEVSQLGLFVYAILWPTILGMLLSEFGKYLFVAITAKLNIEENAKESFLSQFVDAEVSLIEQDYSQAELAHLRTLSAAEKSTYFRELVARQYEAAKENISKRLGKGFIVFPSVIVRNPKMSQELGLLIGPSRTLFSFSISVFAGLSILALVSICEYIYVRNYTKLIATSLPLVVLAIGAFRMSVSNAWDWYTNRAAVLLGLSEQHR